MTETYKIIFRKYDSAIAPNLQMSDTRKSRGNDFHLQKFRFKYDMHIFYFINRVVDAESKFA